MKKIIITLGALAVSLFPVSAYAAVKDYIDMPAGHNFSVGLFGLSYDYSLCNFALGGFVGTGLNLASYQPRVDLGVRAHYKFFDYQNLSAGVIAGVVFDPGDINNNERGKFTPDVGIGVAYKFWDSGFTARLNLTFTSSATGGLLYPGYYSSSSDQMVPNFLQTLTIGPNTSLELGYAVNDHAELTLGGGSIVGMRMNF